MCLVASLSNTNFFTSASQTTAV